MNALEQLCAPIALYPDPLVSLILPASTFPQEISDAANYLQGGGDPNGTGGMGWDASVQGLAHYPQVIDWMASNYNWTYQLGGAFANDSAAVMDAIQELRQQARQVGSLVDTPQQQVVVYDGEIEIEPVQADVIDLPEYDPAVVYVAQPGGFYGGDFFRWSQPFACGVWLGFAFDWHAHRVCTGDWYDYHREHGGWARPVDYTHVTVDHYGNWHAPHGAPPAPPQVTEGRRGVTVSAQVQARFAQPAVFSGAPHAPSNARRVNSIEINRGERGNAPTRNAEPAYHAPANQGEPQRRQQQPNEPQRENRPQPQAQPHPQYREPAPTQHPNYNEPKRPVQTEQHDSPAPPAEHRTAPQPPHPQAKPPAKHEAPKKPAPKSEEEKKKDQQ
ncbi:MAG TPA: DUF3300 domain-containing protein [Opitutaceae bacterium]|jgi:hypothetical protein